MDLIKIIVGGYNVMKEGVDGANKELKGQAKITMPTRYKLHNIGLQHTGEVARLMTDTPVAQLSFDCSVLPEGTITATPATEALAGTDKKETTKKGKGK